MRSRRVGQLPKFATQRQTFVISSGDLGSYVPTDPYNASFSAPQSAPQEPMADTVKMLTVGGTELTTHSTGDYKQETTWNDTNFERQFQGTPENSVTAGGFVTGLSVPGLAGEPQPEQHGDRLSRRAHGPGRCHGRGRHRDPLRRGSGRWVRRGRCAGAAVQRRYERSRAAVGRHARPDRPGQWRGNGHLGDADGVRQFDALRSGGRLQRHRGRNEQQLVRQRSARRDGIRTTITGTQPSVALPFAISYDTSNDQVNSLLPGAAPPGTSEAAGLYHAVTGYDLVTGLGTPTCKLVYALAPSQGTQPFVMASGLPQLLDLAVSGTYVYLATGSGTNPSLTSSILTVAVHGTPGSPAVLASGASAANIAVGSVAQRQ